MNVLVAGGSGFIGGALTRHLTERGHRVAILSRRTAGTTNRATFHWDPARETIDPLALDGIDAVVNLAGENLAGGRWTTDRKRRLVESRVQPTRFLVRLLRERKPSLPALVSASAVGAYGNRGEEVLTEESARGRGFLAELCREWEEAALAAHGEGIRVTVLRFGVAIDRAGGMLRKVLPVFRLGVGGPLGGGAQWMSWIALADLVLAIELALTRADARGIVNVVAPTPVRNGDFARALGRVLRRPAVLPAPAPALRLLFGEMADEALLSSARVEAHRLPALGFRYGFGDLERALRATLKSGSPSPRS